jgi:paired amphipathic helix protein Sin3a
LVTPGGGGGFTTPRALSPSLHAAPLLPPFAAPPTSIDDHPNAANNLVFNNSIPSTTELSTFGQQDGFPGNNPAATTMIPTGAPPINQAIDFVNRIKLRYSDEPEVYRKFLDVLQGYQRESGPLESVLFCAGFVLVRTNHIVGASAS